MWERGWKSQCCCSAFLKPVIQREEKLCLATQGSIIIFATTPAVMSENYPSHPHPPLPYRPPRTLLTFNTVTTILLAPMIIAYRVRILQIPLVQSGTFDRVKLGLSFSFFTVRHFVSVSVSLTVVANTLTNSHDFCKNLPYSLVKLCMYTVYFHFQPLRNINNWRSHRFFQCYLFPTSNVSCS